MPHSTSRSNHSGTSDSARPASAPSATGKCVLVIDDDDAVRRSLSAILTSRGYAVVEAASGEAALASLCNPANVIDAVVLDMQMPGMSGREVLAALRTTHLQLPVLVVSGHDLEGAVDAADIRLRVVQKALGPRALLTQLGELLQPAA